MGVKNIGDCDGALFTMAQLAILLVGQHFVVIAGVEVRNLAYRSRFESAVRIARVPFYYARVTGGVVDKEVVIASCHGVHVVGEKQVDSFLRGGGTVEHQTDDERGVDDGPLRVLVTGLGIQGEYGNGHAAFVNTVELGKRPMSAAARPATESSGVLSPRLLRAASPMEA